MSSSGRQPFRRLTNRAHHGSQNGIQSRKKCTVIRPKRTAKSPNPSSWDVLPYDRRRSHGSTSFPNNSFRSSEGKQPMFSKKHHRHILQITKDAPNKSQALLLATMNTHQASCSITMIDPIIVPMNAAIQLLRLQQAASLYEGRYHYQALIPSDGATSVVYNQNLCIQGHSLQRDGRSYHQQYLRKANNSDRNHDGGGHNHQAAMPYNESNSSVCKHERNTTQYVPGSSFKF